MTAAKQVLVAESEEQIRRCFPVMVQLRPHLSEAGFVAQVETQFQEVGYRLAYIENEEGAVAAVAGFILRHQLSAGYVLYVDDLVTDADTRSGGYGAALLAWLEDYACQVGCDVLDLDSGVQRFLAHRFYFREGMHIYAYHFRKTPAQGNEAS